MANNVINISTFTRTSGNLARMGYFPTQTEDVRRIASYFTSYGSIILDPCCGEGRALKIFSETIKDYTCKTIGIEIEEERAAKAADILCMCFNEDLFNINIDKNSIGCIFLNPPYYSEENLHQQFIEKSTGLLPENGVLILLIPDYELQGRTADFIASYYKDMTLYRSTDKTYKQIILIAQKKKKPDLIKGDFLQSEAKKAEVIDYRQYNNDPIEIPATKDIEDIKITSRSIDPDYLQTILDSFTEDIKILKSLIPEHSNLKRPLLPLRKGHLAQILASGAIDGVITHPETNQKFLIKGTTTRNEEVIEDTEEEIKTITRDVVTILMMDDSGTIQKIK